MIRTITRPFQSPFIALAIFLLTTGFMNGTLILASDTNGTATNATSVQPGEDQFQIGKTFYRGEGVKQSYAQAAFWFHKAAELGNLKAMHNFGINLLAGQGIQKNEKQGYHWIRMAAEKGDPLSAYTTGYLLIKGQGVEKNIPEGVSWLRKAADLGNTDALARLGQDTYFGDDGLKKDHKAAVPFIKAAAEKGNPWACDTLGQLYLKGDGIPKDENKAEEWIAKGIHAGPMIQ